MTAAVALTVVPGLLAAFQLALALGAPFGRFAWGGQDRVLPARLRVGSVIAIAIYALIELVALDRSDVVDGLPDGVSGVAIWVVFAYFVVGIAMNALSPSRPERLTFTPVTIVLSGLSLAIAIG